MTLLYDLLYLLFLPHAQPEHVPLGLLPSFLNPQPLLPLLSWLIMLHPRSLPVAALLPKLRSNYRNHASQGAHHSHTKYQFPLTPSRPIRHPPPAPPPNAELSGQAASRLRQPVPSLSGKSYHQPAGHPHLLRMRSRTTKLILEHLSWTHSRIAADPHVVRPCSHSGRATYNILGSPFTRSLDMPVCRVLLRWWRTTTTCACTT